MYRLKVQKSHKSFTYLFSTFKPFVYSKYPSFLLSFFLFQILFFESKFKYFTFLVPRKISWVAMVKTYVISKYNYPLDWTANLLHIFSFLTYDMQEFCSSNSSLKFESLEFVILYKSWARNYPNLKLGSKLKYLEL